MMYPAVELGIGSSVKCNGYEGHPLRPDEEFDGDITRCLPALRRCDFLPHFAGEWLAVLLRQSSRQINKIAGPHKGHKRRDVAIDHRRGNFRQIDLQSL